MLGTRSKTIFSVEYDAARTKNAARSSTYGSTRNPIVAATGSGRRVRVQIADAERGAMGHPSPRKLDHPRADVHALEDEPVCNENLGETAVGTPKLEDLRAWPQLPPSAATTSARRR